MLKVGDIVRVIHSFSENANAVVGQTGVIVDIDMEWVYPYEVKFDNVELQAEVDTGFVESLFEECELELLKDNPVTEKFVLKMSNLEICFKEAIRVGAKYVAIKVEIPNYKKPEVIINDIENAQDKLDYFKYAYDDNLTVGNGIKITGFTYGDSYEDIKEDLLG